MTTDEEIQKALRNAVTNLKSGNVPKRIDVEREKKDAESFRTYVRANTVSNIAKIPTNKTDERGNTVFERIDTTQHEVPSKKQVKQAVSTNKMLPSNRVFKTAGVGSSRSVILGILKAIAADETGCIVLDPGKARRLREVQKPTTLPNSGTTGMRYNGGIK